jgi:hypothetical protein
LDDPEDARRAEARENREAYTLGGVRGVRSRGVGADLQVRRL